MRREFGERRGRGRMPLIKRSSILSVKTFPIPTVLDDLMSVLRDERWRTRSPGFIGFFSNVPGPRDEVLAEIWHYGVGAHHLGAEDVTEDALVVVEVDGQQFSLEDGNTDIEIVKDGDCERFYDSGFFAITLTMQFRKVIISLSRRQQMRIQMCAYQKSFCCRRK